MLRIDINVSILNTPLFYITSLYPIWKYLMGYFSGYYLIWRRTSHIGAFKLSVTYTIICFLTSEITIIWYRDRSVAHTLRLTNLDLEFASNGKHQRISNYCNCDQMTGNFTHWSKERINTLQMAKLLFEAPGSSPRIFLSIFVTQLSSSSKERSSMTPLHFF